MFKSRRGHSVILNSPGGSEGKESACNAGDLGSIPGLGISPGEGKGYQLQYSGLENPMDTGPGGLQSMWLRQWDTEAASHAHAERHLSVLQSLV